MVLYFVFVLTILTGGLQEFKDTSPISNGTGVLLVTTVVNTAETGSQPWRVRDEPRSGADISRNGGSPYTSIGRPSSFYLRFTPLHHPPFTSLLVTSYCWECFSWLI